MSILSDPWLLALFGLNAAALGIFVVAEVRSFLARRKSAPEASAREDLMDLLLEKVDDADDGDRVELSGQVLPYPATSCRTAPSRRSAGSAI